MSPTSHRPISLRPAVSADIPRLTDIIIASFPADPEWVYRYPYAKQYPEDHYKYTHQRISEYFANTTSGAAGVTVAEIEIANGNGSANGESGSQREIIGWSLWAMPGSHGLREGEGVPERQMKWPSSAQGERRDVHQGHVEAYFKAMHDKKTTLFDDVYGGNQAHLCLLGVDPKYQGRGAGALLVRDMMDKASAGKFYLTLFATGPGGRKLYKKLGFRETEWVKVGPEEGDDEVIEFPGMVWDQSDAK